MFHLNVADRLDYACRLLRKAYAAQARVVVSGPASTLTRLDNLLWTFDPAAFVPHLRVTAPSDVPPHLQDTPIWLIEQAEQAPHRDVLLNLGDELVAGFESFSKVIEIVPVDDAPKAAARQRWKHYALRGYAMKRHEARATQ